MIRDQKPPVGQLVIEEVTDADAVMRGRVQHERHRKNSQWLESHWSELLPQARGKFVAVAAQEPFIAETSSAAWRWATMTHPDDDGAIVQFVPRKTGPRIYVDRR